MRFPARETTFFCQHCFHASCCLLWKHLACRKPLTDLRQEHVVYLLWKTACIHASGRSSYIFISGVRSAQKGCQVASWWQIMLCYLVLTHVMRIIPNHSSEESGERGCTSLLCLVHWTGCGFIFGWLKGSLKMRPNVPFFCSGGWVVMGVAV